MPDVIICRSDKDLDKVGGPQYSRRCEGRACMPCCCAVALGRNFCRNFGPCCCALQRGRVVAAVYKRSGVLTHKGALVARTTPCMRLDACRGRCFGQSALAPAVLGAQCGFRCLLEAHAGVGMGTRGVLEGRPHQVSVAACRRPSRSSPCSARHTACRACTRTAPPEYLIVPRRASESRAVPDLAGLFFCGFSAPPNTSGR
jgi:hypothetical protein